MIEWNFYPYLIFVSIFGLCIGRFLNIIIHRVPIILRKQWNERVHDEKEEKYNLFVPEASCPHCHGRILFIYNIPILGWLYLKGKSRCCNNKINLRYPIVETLTAIITVFIIIENGSIWPKIAALILGWSLIVLAFIDLDKRILPDCITLPLLWCGLLVNVEGMFTSLSSAVIGAAVGYLFFWLTYWLIKTLTGKEGMGYGDFKLMAALGAWFGWEIIPSLTFISSFLGIIGYISLRIFTKIKNKSIAFGPYLAISGIIFIFFHKNFNYFLY
ncbi:prepilin peptidase [Candidatus Regiella insecticola]|uniref:Prepilin leader peptidase/N-methyltransferase n=1 Tax=Candidatus Regiella insecticola TaxID=138073 RepID=A0A6L2ZLG9_9ENTR|nr:A24 family peptidase [Candidatus Regiella insecticola]GFN45200.1 type 4 prepilin-like proteins leader peptide-processing enzyme [Candidatus Regiella insecticola]